MCLVVFSDFQYVVTERRTSMGLGTILLIPYSTSASKIENQGKGQRTRMAMFDLPDIVCSHQENDTVKI